MKDPSKKKTGLLTGKQTSLLLIALSIVLVVAGVFTVVTRAKEKRVTKKQVEIMDSFKENTKEKTREAIRNILAEDIEKGNITEEDVESLAEEYDYLLADYMPGELFMYVDNINVDDVYSITDNFVDDCFKGDADEKKDLLKAAIKASVSDELINMCDSANEVIASDKDFDKFNEKTAAITDLSASVSEKKEEFSEASEAIQTKVAEAEPEAESEAESKAVSVASADVKTGDTVRTGSSDTAADTAVKTGDVSSDTSSVSSVNSGISQGKGISIAGASEIAFPRSSDELSDNSGTGSETLAKSPVQEASASKGTSVKTQASSNTNRNTSQNSSALSGSASSSGSSSKSSGSTGSGSSGNTSAQSSSGSSGSSSGSVSGGWLSESSVGETAASSSDEKKKEDSKTDNSESPSSITHEHTPASPVVEKPATCVSPGKSVVRCAECGEVMFTTEITGGEHQFGEWRVITEATCLEDGKKVRECSACGFIETESIPKGAHKRKETVISEATCTKDGKVSVVCSVCGEDLGEKTIPALGHDFTDDYVIDKEPTCEEAGVKSRHCLRCGERGYEVELISTGHGYGPEVRVNEDGVEDGYIHRLCEVCEKGTEGHDLIVKVIPYTITLKGTAGSTVEGVKAGVDVVDYNVESEDFTIGAANKAGFVFAGWKGEDGTVVSEIEVPTGSIGDKEYTALFEENIYTLSYDFGGADAEEPAPETHLYTDRVVLPEMGSVKKDGYMFLGYALSAEDAAKAGDAGTSSDERKKLIFIGPDESSTVKLGELSQKEITLYASFMLGTYNINYELMGGEMNEGDVNPVAYSVESPSFKLKSPKRFGYTFAGWVGGGLAVSSIEPEIDFSRCSGDLMFTATWKENGYRVRYQKGSGEGDDVLSVAEFKYTKTASLAKPGSQGFNRKGCMHTGWDVGDSLIVADYITDYETEAKILRNGIPVKATYTPITYKITYSIKEGTPTGNNPESYTVNSGDIKLSNPEREGCDFGGWTGTGLDGPTVDVIIPSGSVGTRSYSATWIPKTYDIDYDTAGGEFVNDYNSDYTYLTGGRLATGKQIEREGYDFLGWYDNPDYEGEPYSKIYKEEMGDREFYAKWTPTRYKIRYEMNGGSIEGASPVEYTIETETFTIGDAVKRGNDFLGWSGTGIEGLTDTITIEQGSTGDLTFRANWKPITYSLTYHENGGSYVNEPATEYTYGDRYVLLDGEGIKKRGYDFNGWYDNKYLSGKVYSAINYGDTGDKVFYADWDLVTYTIEYELNGGKNALSNIKRFTVEDNAYVISQPTRVGYDFLGWSGTGIDGMAKEIEIPAASIGNRVYTANWECIKYSLNYRLDGGTNDASNPSYYTIEDELVLKDASKRGYNFVGWKNIDENKEPERDLKIEKGSINNRTYAAYFKAKETNITYDANGGTGTMASRLFTFNPDELNLAPNDFTRKGYRFKNWNTKPDGSGETLANINGVNDFVIAHDGESVTIYAQWIPLQVTLIFNSNGGTGTMTDQVLVYDTSVNIKPNTFTRKGYTFKGWNTKADGSGTAYEPEADLSEVIAKDGK